jgi:general secretion pathway protein D
MKKILILLSFLVNLTFADNQTLNLVQFASYASQYNNINILIDEKLKEETFSFIVNDKKSYYLDAFRKAVNLKNLELIKTNEFYYVRPKNPYIEEPKYRSIKLNFVRYEDIKNFLLVYDNEIKFEFIKSSKILLLRSKEKEFKSIYEMIKTIDVLPTQLKLKVTIIDTNLDKLKEHGADYTSLNLSNNTNLFFNLVSYPFTVKNELNSDEAKGFYTFIKFLNSNGSSELISNPILTLSDEKQTVFNVVNNIPYKTGNTTINNDDTRTTSTYSFKDVGLQISVTPHIYNNQNIYLDLELNVSNVLNNSDNLPTTSKKYLKQSFHLPINKVLVLTGINKKEVLTSSSEVPILSKIPYIDWLFKYESENINNTNLSIVFEIVEN